MALPLIPAGIAAARGLSFYAKSPAGRALMKRMMSKYKTVKGKSNIPNVNPTKGRSTKPSKPPKDFGRLGTSAEFSSEQADVDLLNQNQDLFDEGLKDLIKSLKTKPKRQSNARNRAKRNIPKPVRKPKRKG